jgi:hypothetical protein
VGLNDDGLAEGVWLGMDDIFLIVLNEGFWPGLEGSFWLGLADGFLQGG